MKDHELLELAAKAAGIKFDKAAQNGAPNRSGFDMQGNAVLDWHNGKTWNPLTDDGDAFRLMVALSLDIEFDGPTGMRVNYVDERGRLCTVEQLVLEDLAAAVRRTIVSAAAELGAEK